jgi:hypothetical protein
MAAAFSDARSWGKAEIEPMGRHFRFGPLLEHWAWSDIGHFSAK